MKIDMNLKPSDITLLKVLVCVVIGFFMLRFLIFPGIEKNQDLSAKRDELEIQQQEMQYIIDSREMTEKKIAQQKENLQTATQGFYERMENRQVDELITGLALKHDLFPVYLNIAEPVAGIPLAYQMVQTTQETQTDDLQTNGVFIQYVHTNTATMTLQGTEKNIQGFLDDISRNYPGIQVRSFNMQPMTYIDGSMQRVDLMNCSCVLAVYTYGEITITEGETMN